MTHGITFEKAKGTDRFAVKRYGTTISYIARNPVGEWYVGTIRQTLSAADLRAIADRLDGLAAADRMDAIVSGVIKEREELFGRG